jgi:hypothetical protein
MIIRRDPVTGGLTVVASGLRGLQGLALNSHVLYAAVKRVVALAPVEGAVARYPLLPAGGQDEASEKRQGGDPGSGGVETDLQEWRLHPVHVSIACVRTRSTCRQRNRVCPHS